MSELTEAHRAQVQAHVADYQAIMTRINWFMSLQFLPWAPLVAFIALVVAARTFFHPIVFAWGILGVAQVAVLIYYFALYEVYNHVRYVQIELKPRVAVLLQLGTDLFWSYERHLKKLGKAYHPRYGDLTPAAISAIAFIFVAVIRIPWSWWDCVGSLITAFLVFRTVLTARRVVNVRREFEAAA